MSLLFDEARLRHVRVRLVRRWWRKVGPAGGRAIAVAAAAACAAWAALGEKLGAPVAVRIAVGAVGALLLGLVVVLTWRESTDEP